MPRDKTPDEIRDLRVLVRWIGLRPLRHRRRTQYRELCRAGII
jgi:hypothetical protein